MGCWAIGGPFYSGEESLGWGVVDDAQSIRALHAAYDHGIRIFDTAAVYGAGHSERIVGEALKGRNDCLVVTKFGLRFDEVSKQVLGTNTDPAHVALAIDESLIRLQRESIDLLLLHLNDLSTGIADPLFHEMTKACENGKIKSFGWSTDYPDSVKVAARYDNFVAVEHCMNVFVDTPTIQKEITNNNLIPLIRSPLAMGVLTGKYTAETRFPKNDNRSREEAWRDYFVDSSVAPIHLRNLEAVRECLMNGGRTLTQGALNWIMAKSPVNIPIPGARTADQIIESARSVEFGPLPENIMDEIEALIERSPEGEPRDR
ncbi:MAG: aldo/keto reductase [Gammaproteobacteria bacterium]|nr:aldo/keto reductase [Gammaproteobacteria bacterium]